MQAAARVEGNVTHILESMSSVASEMSQVSYALQDMVRQQAIDENSNLDVVVLSMLPVSSVDRRGHALRNFYSMFIHPENIKKVIHHSVSLK